MRRRIKWFLIFLFTVQIYSQQAKNVVIEDYERYKQKLEDGETLIFKNLRKEYWLILALMLSASSQGQILMSDKGYNPPADVFPPSVPSGLNGVAVSDDSLLFYWTNPPEGDFNRNVIWFMGAVKDSTSNDSIYIGGLTANTTYGLRLLSVDNSGNRSAYCDSVQRTTYDTETDQEVTPEPPTNLVVADSLDDITLTWTNNPPNASNIVIMKDGVDYDTVAYPTATWSESDTTDGVYYTYKIYAYNTGGESDTTSTVTAERYSSNTRYVSSGGNNSNSGTNPNLSWKTTGKVNSEWLSGLTVKFKSGDTFSDAALVTQSYTAYSIYGGGERATLRLPSLTSTDFVVDNFDKDYVTLANLEIIGRLYINFKSSSHLKIKNIHAHHYNTADDQYMAIGLAPMYGDYTSDLYMEIENSIITGGFPTDQQVDLFNLTRSSKYYIHDCYLANITHSIFGTNRGWDGIIEHNRLYNTYHSIANFQSGDSNMVMRYNYLERSGIGSYDNEFNEVDRDMGGLYLHGQNHIFGFNVLKKSGAQRGEYNYLPAIDIISSVNGGYLTNSKNTRIYNNTIYDTYGMGLRLYLANDGAELSNIKIFNNAFVKANDTSWYYSSGTGVVADSAIIQIVDENSTYNFSNNLVDFNYFGAKDSNLYSFYDAVKLATTNYALWTGITFENNSSGGSDIDVFAGSEDDSILNYTYWIPTTVRGELYDTLIAQFGGSGALVDAGRAHAYVSGNQTNDSILVDDVYPFFKGITGLKDGDSVYINGDRLKITAIDYTNSKLVFNASVTVLDNEGVYIIIPYTNDAFKGSEINIGLE